MASSRPNKGRRRRRRRRSSKKNQTSIKMLPKELLMEVLARVASNSISDLHKAKTSCRDFLQASNDDYIYQHVSMAKIPLIPWFITEKESSFLKRCRESGNSESLYREGMVEYFSSSNIDSGLESLRKACEKGHEDAKYVYGMILICSGEDEEVKKRGLEILRFLRVSKCIKRCRKRVESFVWSMWIRNRVVRNRRPLCHHGSRKMNKFSRGWPLLNEDEEEEDGGGGIGVSCEYCIGDYELSLFCDLFSV